MDVGGVGQRVRQRDRNHDGAGETQPRRGGVERVAGVASIDVHGNRSSNATRGGRSRATMRGAMRPGAASTLASRAASPTLRVNVPSVSSVSLNR